MKMLKAPGVTAYAAIALWFLLTVLNPVAARAGDGAVILRASDILPEIEAALMAKGLGDGAVITLADEHIHFAAEKDIGAEIENVSFNAASGRFLVRVANKNGAPVAIAGMAITPRRMPVLVRDLERGAMISEADIDWTVTDQPAAGYVDTIDDLVGMTARRDLASGAPIRKTEIAAPVLVKRNALVTMVYEAAGLSLTHYGVAMQSGVKGEVIEVKNAKSDRVIKAFVAGDNLVSVSLPRHAALESKS